MEYLEDTQDFDEDALPDVVSLDAGKKYYNDKCNEYVAEGLYKSNNDSSPPVHVDIPEYQFQNMNVEYIKEKKSAKKQ